MAEKRLKYTAEQIDSAIEKVKNMPSEGIVGPQGPIGETGATGAAGKDGKEIELQKTSSYIQWRYVGGSWNNLVALADLKGDKGDGANVDLNDYALKSWVNEQIARVQAGGSVDLSSYYTKTEVDTKISSKANISDLHNHSNKSILDNITSSKINEWDNKSTLALGTSSSTAFRGDYGNVAYTHSQSAHAPYNAEANVQADWNVSDTSSDAYIKNKPVIPVAYDDSEIRSSINKNTENISGLVTKIGTKVEQSYVDEAIRGVTSGAAEISGLTRHGSSNGHQGYSIKTPIKPCITFTDDDGKAGVYTKWRPILQEKNISMSICVITNYVGDNGYLTWEQLRELQNTYGCEILSHTDNHSNFTNRYNSEIVQMLRNSKEVLMKNGLRVKGFAYPNGGFYSKDAGLDVSYLCAKDYDYAVITQNKINTYPISNSMLIDRCAIGCYESTELQTLDGMKTKVNECIQKNGWLIFMTHVDDVNHTTEDTTNIGLLIDYIKSLGTADIVTLEEGYRRFGNILESDKGQLTNQGELIGLGGGSGSYILPKATSTTLGGIKLGSGLTSDGNGVVSVTGGLDTSNYYSRTEVDYYINQLSDRITLLEGSSGENTPTVTYGQIVLSKSTSTITEGGTDTFTVKLDKSPTNNQVVTLSKNNEDVTISPNSLTFTPINYSTSQTVTITAAEDNTDYANETCTITLSSPNVMTKSLTVNITDNDSEPTVTPPTVTIPTDGLLLNLDTTNGSGDTVTETANNTKFILTRFANDGVGSGWLDSGLKFNGTSDSLISDKNNNLKVTSGDFSYVIKTKIKFDKAGIIFTSATGSFSLQMLSANALRISYADSSNSWKNFDIGNLSLDGSKVYTIAIVVNGSSLLFYMDGVLKNTFECSTGFTIYNDANVGYTIGANQTGWASYANITLYKFLKYNRALTISEIESISNI